MVDWTKFDAFCWLCDRFGTLEAALTAYNMGFWDPDFRVKRSAGAWVCKRG